MELPVAVQQALGETAAGVSLRDAGTASRKELLRMVLLTDEQGNFQVICRKDDLIDLEQMNKELGRDLRLMKRREQVRVRERAGLKALPALPSLTGWPTLVDERVDKLSAVALELGEQNLSPSNLFR
jgi:prolyl-tRNA editing enzyme YbaK/EbsC (Cys-tRNA(Pro) deacylase)